MQHVISLVVSVIMFVLGNPAWLLTQQNSAKEASVGTKVIDYSPDYIPSERLEGGWCWTRSIAAPANPKAWRCMGPESTASGSITYGFDPCFALDNQSVVCDVDPEKSGTGIELRLREVLPKEQIEERKTDPGFWRIRLATGALCTPHTGTMSMTNEKRFLLYFCDDGTGIYEDSLHESGGRYEAENVTYGPTDNPEDGNLVVNKIETVAIKEAWR